MWRCLVGGIVFLFWLCCGALAGVACALLWLPLCFKLCAGLLFATIRGSCKRVKMEIAATMLKLCVLAILAACATGEGLTCFLWSFTRVEVHTTSSLAPVCWEAKGSRCIKPRCRLVVNHTRLFGTHTLSQCTHTLRTARRRHRYLARRGMMMVVSQRAVTLAWGAWAAEC